MSRERLIAILVGLVVACAAAAGVLWFNQGSRMILDGSIRKVRTQALDESCALIVDFRVTNPANYRYVVGKVEVFADVDGSPVQGVIVADVDAKRFFDYYPAIGPKFNDSLKSRDKLQPKESVDRMLAVRFEISESRVLARKNLTIRVEEVDGVVTEIFEKPR